MKIVTVLGTRPEIIRLSRVIERLDELCEHVVVHTGQNYDVNLKDIFFQQLGVRAPNYYLDVRGSIGEQIGQILARCEAVFQKERPDRLLLLGDTNSALAAIIAKRIGIPVFHMEAGNRCFDDRVPEEVNRRIIDHCSDVLLPYTERSRANLLREGIPGQRIYVTGNPIYEVIRHYEPQISQSNILAKLHLEPRRFFLATIHRAENVDVQDRLSAFTATFDRLQREHGLPVVVSTHPRTLARLQTFRISRENANVRYLEPFGFFDFVTLEKNALCTLSDSGTVQEECAIFRVPNVTIRDVTERPETIEHGTNVLSGADPSMILSCVNKVLHRRLAGNAPPEYLVEHVSETVTNVVLGHYSFGTA